MSQVMPTEERAVGLLRQHGEHLNAWFGRSHGRHPDAPPRLLDAIEYSLLAGGKRLRPTLVLECASTVDSKASTNPSVLAAAAAIGTHPYVQPGARRSAGDGQRRPAAGGSNESQGIW